jgi:rhamnogalacturonyl hydrolase YesR
MSRLRYSSFVVITSALIGIPLPAAAQQTEAPGAAAERPDRPQSPVAPGTNPSSLFPGRLQPAYPTPYPPATEAEIKAVLDRVVTYLEVASPARVVDAATREPVADIDRLPERVVLERGDFQIISYEWGVTYSGMLLASEITGDARFANFTATRMEIIGKLAAHMKDRPPPADADQAGRRRGMFMRSVLAPRSLDDSGSMAAAMIKAHRAGLGGALRPWIDNYLGYISTGQMRLADGTLARNRPLPDSLWLDDLYMSVPALAQMGKLTGERKYYDDAVKQILQFADRMFVKEKGLFMHGWVQGMDTHPVFHWGRANGWAILATTELLEVLPEDHPGRPKVLNLLRAHIRGLAAVQGHSGMWHQLLDRTESYEETSATAIFAFCVARAINRGWVDALAHGPMASLAWNAVATRVNEQGQVEAVCVGTGMGWEPMFYMYRPVSVFAAHGYGPVLLAGAEMIALRRGAGAEATVHDGGVHFGKALSPF